MASLRLNDEHTVLDWFDMVDEHGEVVLVLASETLPPAKGAAMNAWFREAMTMSRHYGLQWITAPFTASSNLARTPWTVVRGVHEQNLRGPEVHIRLPLTALFCLPGVKPKEELTQMKEFLTWVHERSQAGEDGAARLQWFRGGSNSRGLEWAGIPEGDRAQWQAELDAWQEKPWFKAWHDNTLKCWSRRWHGVHCWAVFDNLEPRDMWGHKARRPAP